MEVKMRCLLSILILLVISGLCAQAPLWDFYNAPVSHSPMVTSPDYVYLSGSPGLIRINVSTQAIERFYSFNSGLAMSQIYSLYYDSSGVLWIGGENALVSFDGVSTWQNHDLSAVFYPPGVINAITKDAQGFLWLGSNNGLYKTDLVSWVRYSAFEVGLQNFNVTAVLVDHLNRVWAACSGSYGDLVCYDNGAWNLVGSHWNGIYYILQDQNQNIWVGGDELRRYNGSSWTQIPDPGLGRIWHYFRCGTLSANGAFYTGTMYGDIYKYTGNTWTLYRDHYANADTDGIYSMASDAQNNLWFGTTNVYRNLSAISGLNQIANPSDATSFVRDQQNRLWVGHNSNGVSCFDGNSWQSFGSSSYTWLQYGTKDLAVDSAGNLWIAQDSRIVLNTGGQWTYLEPPLDLMPQRSYRYIAIDNNDQVWLGGPHGLLSFDGTSWQAYTPANSILLSNSIQDILLDQSGRVWIATQNGLALNDHGNWTMFHVNTGPYHSNEFLSLCEDSQHRIWAQLYNFIARFEDSEWTGYPIPSPISESFPGSSKIACDAMGRVWVNLYYNGLAIFDGNDWQLSTAYESPLQGSMISAAT